MMQPAAAARRGSWEVVDIGGDGDQQDDGGVINVEFAEKSTSRVPPSVARNIIAACANQKVAVYHVPQVSASSCTGSRPTT